MENLSESLSDGAIQFVDRIAKVIERILGGIRNMPKKLSEADQAGVKDFLDSQFPLLMDNLSAALSDDAAPLVERMKSAISYMLENIDNRPSFGRPPFGMPGPPMHILPFPFPSTEAKTPTK